MKNCLYTDEAAQAGEKRSMGQEIIDRQAAEINELTAKLREKERQVITCIIAFLITTGIISFFSGFFNAGFFK